MPTVAERDVGRSNNFDAMRFIAASMVILSHSYALLDLKGDEPLTHLYSRMDLGSLAVDIFFVISGYLITKSMLRRTSALAYVEARVLRIVPGLVAASVLGVFVLAPFTATQGVPAYLASRETWMYFVVNTVTVYLSPHHWTMPGVFQHTFRPGSINGSLWTLGAEVELYVFVFVAGLCAMIVRNARLRSAGITLGFLLLLAVCMWRGHLYREPDPGNIYRLTAWFMCGALVYMARARVPVNALVAVALWLLYAAVHETPVAGLAFYLAVTYAVFAIGFHPRLRAWSFTRRGDFSYGLYIYAFPIQQLLVDRGIARVPLVLFVLAYPLTLGAAMLSWRYLERPALGSKGALSGRWRRAGKAPELERGPEVAW